MTTQEILDQLGEPVDIINPAQATEVLRAQGWKISPEMVRMGVQQGQFPWGTCIMKGGTPRTFVYVQPMMRWIQSQKGERA